MLKILPLTLGALLVPALPTNHDISAQLPSKVVEEVIDSPTSSAEPIKWIDPVILKKLQEIAPAKYKGYAFDDVMQLFPKNTQTVGVFLGDARVDRVYSSTAGQVIQDLYGKGATYTGTTPNQPVYVFEATHTQPVAIPTSPGRPAKQSSNAKVTVISDMKGNAIFTKTLFPE